MPVRSLLKILCVVAALFGAMPGYAAEAPYPNRPIRLIVPYPPGGSTDPTARAYGTWISDKLGALDEGHQGSRYQAGVSKAASV